MAEMKTGDDLKRANIARWTSSGYIDATGRIIGDVEGQGGNIYDSPDFYHLDPNSERRTPDEMIEEWRSDAWSDEEGNFKTVDVWSTERGGTSIYDMEGFESYAPDYVDPDREYDPETMFPTTPEQLETWLDYTVGEPDEPIDWDAEYADWEERYTGGLEDIADVVSNQEDLDRYDAMVADRGEAAKTSSSDVQNYLGLKQSDAAVSGVTWFQPSQFDIQQMEENTFADYWTEEQETELTDLGLSLSEAFPDEFTPDTFSVMRGTSGLNELAGPGSDVPMASVDTGFKGESVGTISSLLSDDPWEEEARYSVLGVR